MLPSPLLCLGSIAKNKYNIQDLSLRSGEVGHLKARYINVLRQQLRESIRRVRGRTHLAPCIE